MGWCYESEKGIECLSNLVKQRMNTHTILVGAPQRHDLLTESCVNEEVVKCNRKLLKMMKMFKYANVLDSEVKRECYTRHGLHMNGVGKELMAQRIMDQIREILLVKKTPPP